MGKECIAPADIQEGDLVAFLEGVAPVRVAGHITRCPACAAEVEELRLGDALFRRAFAPANYKLMTGQPPPTPAQILTLNQNRPFRLPWGFRGVTMRRMAAVALVLLLMGLQIGFYNLFNRPADEAPTVTVQEGVATVVVTVKETTEIIRNVATRVTSTASTGPGEGEEVVNGLTDGRVIIEDMVEIAPPRSLRERIDTELRGGTGKFSVYASAVARAEKDRVLTGTDGDSYAVWTADQAGQTAIYFVSSADGGQSWSHNVQISRGLEKIYNPRLAVDAENDNLYVVWRSGYSTNANIYLARSTDNGQTWSKSVRVDGAVGSILNPSLTVDDAGGVYVSWQNRDRTSISIYFIHSPDGGETWSNRIRVANIGG